jgi:hypothetical protein
MAVVKLYDLARMTTATTGTGTMTLGAAVSPYLSFAQAGVQNGDTVRYAIYDPTVGGSEIGFGVYTASGTTLTRNPTTSTASNSPINLSGLAQVFITASALDIPSLSGGTNIWQGDQLFKNGRPWADVVAWGAVLSGTVDDGPAIQNAADYLNNTYGGGTLYFPPSMHNCLVNTAVTLNGHIRVLGSSAFTGAITTILTTSDITIFTLPSSFSTLESLCILGYQNINATKPVISITGSHCRLTDVNVQGGYYNISNASTDCYFEDVAAFGAYGTAGIYCTAGSWFNRVQCDNLWPGGTPSSFSPWSGSTPYLTVGTVVTSQGYFLQLKTAGTSGGSAPSLTNYATHVNDGSAVWYLVGPTTFYPMQLDTGASETTITFGDFTGVGTNALYISNSLGGVAPQHIKIEQSIFSQTTNAGIFASAGYNLMISDCEIAGPPGGYGIQFGSGWGGDATVANCWIENGAYGIYLGGGTNHNFIGNRIYGATTAGIGVAANITNFNILGNSLGTSLGLTNANAVVIASGTSNYYNIVGNTIHDATSGIMDGGSGSNKIVDQIGGLSMAVLDVPIIFGGSAANSSVILQSTSNGSPSGDVAAIKASTILLRNPGTGTTAVDIGVAGATAGQIVLASPTANTITLVPAASATGTLTFPSATDTFALLTLGQTFTNKTLTSSTNVLGGVTMTLGSDATGDTYHRNSSGVLTRLAIGSAGNILSVSGGLPAWEATTAITALGTIATGVWQGTAIAGPYGGTGLTTAAIGDLIYASATTPAWSRLADVATGSVLVSGGVNTAPNWSATPSVTSIQIANNNAIYLSNSSGAADGALKEGTGGSVIFLMGSVGNFYVTDHSQNPILFVNGVGTNGPYFNFFGASTAAASYAQIAATAAATSTTTGALQVSGGLGIAGAGFFGAPVVLPHYTVAGLPSASTYAYGLAIVTDATLTSATGLGLAPTGGGANVVPVFSNGSGWIML